MEKRNLQVCLELVMRSDEVGGHHVPQRHRTHKHSQQALQHITQFKKKIREDNFK
jgi:hypothetical protein